MSQTPGAMARLVVPAPGNGAAAEEAAPAMGPAVPMELEAAAGVPVAPDGADGADGAEGAGGADGAAGAVDAAVGQFPGADLTQDELNARVLQIAASRGQRPR